MGAEKRHSVTVVANGRAIGQWEDYEITKNVLEPSGTFRLERAWSIEAWTILRRDTRVRVVIDQTTVLDGHIAKRSKQSRANAIVIEGHDRAARIVQESAPAIDYDGLDMIEAIRRLADPWIKKITLTNARNRNLSVGKGFKVAGNDSAPIPIHKQVRRGRVHPGQSRWSIIQEIASNAGLMAWISADSSELFVGQPNLVDTPSQYDLVLARPGSTWRTTVLEMDYVEDNNDRFSMIGVVGTGGGTDTDYGINVSSRRSVVFDNEINTLDGTGRDFLEPKRMLMPEAHFDSNGDADSVARREKLRRDFKRTTVTASMKLHGQWIDPGSPSLFTPGTYARVRDEEMEPVLDEKYFTYAATFRAKRETAETTSLELVPAGTEMVL